MAIGLVFTGNETFLGTEGNFAFFRGGKSHVEIKIRFTM